MGQEKSIPVRCNSFQEYSSAPISRSPSRSTTSTKSTILSTTSTINTTRTRSSTSSASSSASYKSIEKQSKYLKEQLYVKTYLDIVEEDQTAKRHFQPARAGIRNYTPKILLEESPPSSSSGSETEADVWI